MKKLFPVILSMLIFSPLSYSAANNEVVIALKPDKNPDAMVAERKDLENFFSEQLKMKAKVIVPMSGAVIQEGLANGTIDLAYVSGMEMIKADKIADLLLATKIKGKTSYESYWVTLKEKNYASIKDLKGKPVSFASRTSTSGYLIPVFDLVTKNLLQKGKNPEEFFGKGNVNFGTGYVSAIERVLSGEVEAAAVSDYVILGDKHLTTEQKAKLKVLQAQGPVPSHLLAVRKNLDAKTKKDLEKALLSLNQNPALRDRLFTAELTSTTKEKQLANLREALKSTGISLE
jgi:phosphonate transport system substrate-binding protein